MSIELYERFWRARAARPSAGRMMPYNWGALPNPLNAFWLPYASMCEEFSRELANAINAFTTNIDSLAAWVDVVAPLDDNQKMQTSYEFIDALATNTLNAPYALRSRFIFATAHLCHQANRTKPPKWVDNFPLDNEVYFDAADACGAPWRSYNKLKRCIEGISARKFQTQTHHFRNAYNHRFSPRFLVGLTNFVIRQVDPKTGSIYYGFGSTPALELPDITESLTCERERIYSAFEAFRELVREHEDAIVKF